MLVDTEGLVLKAKVHSAKVLDQEGIKPLLKEISRTSSRVSRTYTWTPATGGKDKGRGWVEKVLGWSVDLVKRPRKPPPEEVLKLWAQLWSKEGVGTYSCIPDNS